MKTLTLMPGVGPTRKHVQVVCAAEELLEALQDALDVMTQSPQWENEEPAISRARAAIAKATVKRS